MYDCRGAGEGPALPRLPAQRGSGQRGARRGRSWSSNRLLNGTDDEPGRVFTADDPMQPRFIRVHIEVPASGERASGGYGHRVDARRRRLPAKPVMNAPAPDNVVTGESGFALPELMIAMLITTVGVLATFGAMGAAGALTTVSERKQAASTSPSRRSSGSRRCRTTGSPCRRMPAPASGPSRSAFAGHRRRRLRREDGQAGRAAGRRRREREPGHRAGAVEQRPAERPDLPVRHLGRRSELRPPLPGHARPQAVSAWP